MKSVVDGLNQQIYQQGSSFGVALLETVETFFAQTVTLPELKVNADKFKRDSRPYMMPVYDEPLGAIRVVFIMDSPVKNSVSRIYNLLDTWRAFVRAGRGRMSTEGANITLNTNYRIDFAFPITLTLLRGENDLSLNIPDGINNEYTSDRQSLAAELSTLSPEDRRKRVQSIMTSAGVFELPSVDNDLQVAGEFALDKAWLSSFKISDLDYKQGNVITTIEAMIYAETIRNIPTSKYSARGSSSQ